MNHLDLFSGIGGFSLAGQWVWGEDHYIHRFIEIDLFCQKVLKKHWPSVPVHDDIRTYNHDGTKVDLLTGGFPCQPFSVAGKQRGKEDDRYLWPEMLRVITEVKPAWVIGENVAGINGIFQYEGFSEMEGKEYCSQEEAEVNFKEICERTGKNTLWVVLDDLKKLGYSIQPFIIPACAVDAPHRRDRVWILAHSLNGSNRTDGRPQRKTNGTQGKHRSSGCARMSCGTGEDSKDVADAKCIHDDSTRHGTSKDGRQQSGQTEIFRDGCKWLPEPGICRVANGVPRRVDRLRALGNAIVPQVVVPIMEGIKALS